MHATLGSSVEWFRLADVCGFKFLNHAVDKTGGVKVGAYNDPRLVTVSEEAASEIEEITIVDESDSWRPRTVNDPDSLYP